MDRPLADSPHEMLGLLDPGFVFAYCETCAEVCYGSRCSACRGVLVEGPSADEIRSR